MLRSKRSPSWVLAQAATVVGLLSALVGLIFLLSPDLQPEPASQERSATLQKLDFQPRFTLRQYLQRVDLPTTSFTAQRLKKRGAFVEYRYTITGYKDRRIPVKYELINAATGNQVAEARPAKLEALANKDGGTWHAWVPLPKRHGRFYVLIQLLEPSTKVPLDRMRTTTFRISR